jgi:hypothetical protein
MLLIAAILIQLVIGDASIDDSREHRRLPTYDDNGECDDIGGNTSNGKPHDIPARTTRPCRTAPPPIVGAVGMEAAAAAAHQANL